MITDRDKNAMERGRKALDEIIETGRATDTQALHAKAGIGAAARYKQNDEAQRIIDAGAKWSGQKIPDAPHEPDGTPIPDAVPEIKDGSHWAKSVAGRLTARGQAMGVKALLTGEVSTPPAVEVAPLPERPATLLDLVAREGLGERTFSYLRQVARDSSAAVVADGDTKPTSTYTFTEIEDRARVIAHLSEPFPIRYAEDHASMVQLLDGQMNAGIIEAIEDLIINGTGTGEQWQGILATSGVREVDFTTDLVTTLRRARTVLETAGVPVTGVAMHPADVERLELLRESGDSGGFLIDGSAYERIFGPSVSGVPSLAVPEGTAIVGNWNVTTLLVRQNAHTLAATQAGDLFDTNRMKLRSEGRFGFKFTQPGSLATVSLTGNGNGNGDGD